MLDWSKSRNSTNPGWPPDAILNYKKAFIENDRKSSVLDPRHLQATFMKKSAFYNFFPFQAHFWSNAPGLHYQYTHTLTLWPNRKCPRKIVYIRLVMCNKGLWLKHTPSTTQPLTPLLTHSLSHQPTHSPIFSLTHPSMESTCTPSKEWDEITYPLQRLHRWSLGMDK